MFSPGIIFIQETKAKTLNKFSITDYESFELVRKNCDGGGQLIAVHKQLDPVEIMKDEEHEILVVEASLADRRIRLINGYGPQETQTEKIRKSFYTHLDLEVKKSKLAGALVCIEMDSNAKLGPSVIPLDPREQSENGKLLNNIICENGLILVNASELCKGVITRQRQTINGLEESAIDHFIVCVDTYILVKSMVVDEEGKFALTKYANKSGSRIDIKKSDHRTLLLNLNVPLNQKHSAKSSSRIEVFDYKNVENFRKYVTMTNHNEELLKCAEYDPDLERASKKWLNNLNKIIKTCFTKIRVKKTGLNPDLESLFEKREQIITNIGLLKDQNPDLIASLNDNLKSTGNAIGDFCAEKNRKIVIELLDVDDDSGEGVTSSKIWDLKKKLVKKNATPPPCAKKDENGTLVTDKFRLEELYLRTYETRLKPNSIPQELEQLSSLKEYLLNLRLKTAEKEVTKDWTMKELEVALGSLKNNKARDSWGHTYELFKYGGKDLKISLLTLLNRVKKTQYFPTIFTPSTITSIWKKKGDQTNLDNDRGLFNVTKIRSILDKLIYNDIYKSVDQNMSNSNIGARKDRNIRDHIFVINAILNEASNGPNKTALDLQIFDVSKCFDKLEFNNTMNDLYSAGVQNDKIILIANSNRECKVSVKMPWGAPTKTLNLKKIEMQGTVLAPLKCSVSIDKVGRKHSNICIAMIDDILTVTKCSISSVKINALVETKINNKQLEMSHSKCAHMHIGKGRSDCRSLRINSSIMKRSSKEKYLGSILSKDGKITKNIADRHNKGMVSANNILSLLKEVHFGQYYFEMSALFRSSILINGMLYSIEALHGLTSTHIQQLEACDKYLLCKVFDAVSTTATESFYLEMGILPIRFTLVARRLMFFWSILHKPRTELVKQVFLAQKLAPLKSDWVSQIEDDLKTYNINFTETEISEMKKERFRTIVKESVKEQGRLYLTDLMSKHSKSKGLICRMEMQPYLKCKSLSLLEKQLLFKFRTYTYACKANFRSKFQANLKCIDCNQEDTQEHLLNCKILEKPFTDVQYNDIFGTVQDQCRIVKVLSEIHKKRTQLDIKSS